MSKTLRTAALVVGAVALVATGVGAAASAGLIGTGVGSAATVAGISAATLTSVGALAGVAAGVLSFAASVAAKGPSIAGDQTKWTANKDQGIPWVVGRTSVSGWIIHRATWDYSGSKDNAYQTFVAVRSGMPTYQLESFSIDGEPISFSGDAALGAYAGSMWLNQQHGAMPEAAALPGASFKPSFPGWTSGSKLSGCDAYTLTLKWDDKGKMFPSGPPEPTSVLLGAMVWDPRKDSTYPGGSGAHRPDDPATWEYTESGPLLGLAWVRGLYQNGKRVMGIGFALAAINVGQFVEAANIAQANGWKCGGVVYSTDSKWEVLKKLLATASAEPLKLAGSIGCAIDTPRVPLATITTADIIGDWSVTATPSSRDRFNGVIPKYRSEEHGWELVDADVVRVPEYVADDGRESTRALTFELVQDVDQVAELALYQICNAREFGPIVVPLKIRWIGYRPGDCLRIASPELGMDNQDVIITRRHLDPLSGAVTLTMRSETAGKHAFALGQTGTPPPTPSLQVVDRAQLLIPGYSAGWAGVYEDDPAHPKPEDGATRGMLPSEADLLAGLHASIAAAMIAIADAEARIDEIEGTISVPIDELEARILAAEGEIVSLTSDLATANSSISTVSTAVSNVEGDLADITVRVGAAETTIETQTLAIETIDTQVASVTTDLATAGSNISLALTAIDVLEGNQATIESTVTAQGASITSLTSATSTLSGQVATLETRVSAAGNNLLPNGSFENGMAGWNSNMPGWAATSSPTGWGSYAFSSHNPPDGSYTVLYSDLVRVDPNTPYTLSADMGQFHSTPSTAQHYVQIDWYQADGTTFIPGSAVGPGRSANRDFDQTGQSRQALKVTATSPSNAQFASACLVYFKSSGTVISQVARQIKLERGTTATRYSQESSIIQNYSTLAALTSSYAGLTSTVSVQGVSITSNATAISTVNGNITTLFGRASLRLGVGNRVIGWETNNNGSYGDFIIHTDYFGIADPDGGAGFSFSAGAGKVNDPTGVTRFQFGNLDV